MAVELVLGGHLTWYAETDRHARTVCEHHWPDVPNLGDIRTVDWTRVEPVDVLTAGFPCQDISNAGKRAGPSNGLRPGHNRRREWFERGLFSPKFGLPSSPDPLSPALQGDPVPSAVPSAPASVIIAIDPDKASWTAVAVDNRLQPLAAIRIEVNRDGYRQLRRFAGRWPHATWAVEGATGLGAALTVRLSADGVDVVDVPAKLARRVRLLSTGHGRKTDQADALSVGIAAHTAARLNTAVVDEAIAALRCLTEHRDDLVRSRTQIVNRLHALLAQLIPAGLPRGLTADNAAAALRSIRPRAVLARTMRQVAVDLLGEVRRLDRRIAEATATLSVAVAASGTTLTDLHGIGDVTAAKILARAGVVNRFRSESAFASYCVAPIEVSSRDVQRHRLSRADDRQLNYALHVMAMAQIKRATPGRDYYQRKRAAGKPTRKPCAA
ncbi:transposase [Micromonospora profundi]|uniref:Transposase n=1 Tax=Micromonospora profundi TaxID=1420889 RepID=A0AAJ6HNH0_9ACTN|nr:transposase [Micromonospora profundi]WLS43252.1 transposase [Micromonospora profundi]